MTRNGQQTYRLALLGIFTAILIIQNFLPYAGYIVLPGIPLEITIIPITVIVAALAMNLTDGIVIGAVWGVLCVVRAYVAPSSPLDVMCFRNPLVSILPRACVGFAGAGVYRLLTRLKLPKGAALPVCGVLGSLTNTVLVLGMIYVVYNRRVADLYEMSISDVLPMLLGVVATNGVAEAITAAVLVTAIGLPVTAYLERRAK